MHRLTALPHPISHREKRWSSRQRALSEIVERPVNRLQPIRDGAHDIIAIFSGAAVADKVCLSRWRSSEYTDLATVKHLGNTTQTKINKKTFRLSAVFVLWHL